MIMRTNLEMVELSVADMGEMMELEHKVCTSPIQAQAETIRKRLDLGNIMLGVWRKGLLVGSIGFRYSTFSPDDLDSFPKSFRDFSTPTLKPETYNAGFCYSVNVNPTLRTLAVHPEAGIGLRTTGIGKLLITSMTERMVSDGCTYLVGDGRPAFYGGSFEFPQEYYEKDLKLKKILDDCAVVNRQPTEEERLKIIEYPIFRAYNKALGGGLRALWVLPNFFRSDTPAGGFRVILYKRLV